MNEEQSNILVDYKAITGFETHAELAAYEKGREHEQNVIIKWIEKWDGSANSHLGALLAGKLADAWDKGYREGCCDGFKNKTPNPYRKEETK